MKAPTPSLDTLTKKYVDMRFEMKEVLKGTLGRDSRLQDDWT